MHFYKSEMVQNAVALASKRRYDPLIPQSFLQAIKDKNWGEVIDREYNSLCKHVT